MTLPTDTDNNVPRGALSMFLERRLGSILIPPNTGLTDGGSTRGTLYDYRVF